MRISVCWFSGWSDIVVLLQGMDTHNDGASRQLG